MRLVRSDGSATSRTGKARTLVVVVILALVAVCAWAWVDGGREPLREIVQPIPVPEQAR